MTDREDQGVLSQYKKGRSGSAQRANTGGSILRGFLKSGSRESSPGAKIRAAIKVPEAVVKVISYGANKRAVGALIDYISRKGGQEIELKDGSKVEDREGNYGSKAVVDQWATHFRERKNARNAVHLALSVPAGNDPEKLRSIARQFGRENFGDGLDYAFVIHTDTKNPHAHFVVVRDGTQPNYIGFSKPEIATMRERFAEIATEQGIPLNATRRLARGQAEKGERMAVRKARDREGESEVEQFAALSAYHEARGSIPKDTDMWSAPIKKRLDAERSEYESLSTAIKSVGALYDGPDGKFLGQLAKLVNGQAMSLRQAATRREKMLEIAREEGTDRLDELKGVNRILHKYRAERETDEKKERQLKPKEASVLLKQIGRFDDQLASQLKGMARDGDVAAGRLHAFLNGEAGRSNINDGRDLAQVSEPQQAREQGRAQEPDR